MPLSPADIADCVFSGAADDDITAGATCCIGADSGGRFPALAETSVSELIGDGVMPLINRSADSNRPDRSRRISRLIVDVDISGSGGAMLAVMASSSEVVMTVVSSLLSPMMMVTPSSCDGIGEVAEIQVSIPPARAARG